MALLLILGVALALLGVWQAVTGSLILGLILIGVGILVAAGGGAIYRR